MYLKPVVLPYRPRLGLALATLLGFGGVCWLLTERAVASGSVLDALLAAISGLMSLAGLPLLWMRLWRPQRVVLAGEGVEVPRGRTSSEGRHIPWDAMHARSIQVYGGVRFVVIATADGLYQLPESMFEAGEAFDAVAAHLGLEPPPTTYGLASFVAVMQRAGFAAWAMLAWCGGPLVCTEWLEPQLGFEVAFGSTLLPHALLVLGALSLEDDPDDGLSRSIVQAGVLGAVGLGMCTLLGIVLLWLGPVRPDGGLLWTGCAAGVFLTAWYARAASAWLRSGRQEASR